ncbi:hypothetical protein DFH09DRAFT_1322803 [Mycena vulgaris]|nr:hypothetical protein DFH09DRAFT_1322803 [Mycena vulgaris]
MKSCFSLVAFVASAAALATRAPALSIRSPTLATRDGCPTNSNSTSGGGIFAIECQPFEIDLCSGTPPFFVLLSVFRHFASIQFVRSVQTRDGASVATFPATTATSITWVVSVTAGTVLKVELKDSTGAVGFSDPFVVATGSDSCLASGGSGSSGTPASVGLGMFCTDTNFAGNCIEIFSPVPFTAAHPIACANFAAPFVANVSSAHGVADGYTCFLYPGGHRQMPRNRLNLSHRPDGPYFAFLSLPRPPM